MTYIKKIFNRANWWFALLAVLELVFLFGRFAGDYHAGQAIDITPDLLLPYVDGASNDSRGVQIENYTGLFATTRWMDLEAGSYQVVVNYVNNGNDGSVRFLDEIMPTARYDVGALSHGQTRTTMSLWMPHDCETAQLQFYANCGEGQVTFITGAQLVPTHAYAYVRFLTAFVVLLAADYLLLLWRRVLPFPLRSVRARYSAAAVAGIVAFACLPLGLEYLTYGHDLTIHLTRIEALKAGLLSGQFPVRMDPGMLNDAGYPFSLMYADLLLYPAAVLRIFGFSLQTVYKLYVAGVTLGTALITRFVLRRMFDSEQIALTGTALYVLSFYRMSNTYVRAAVGEYSAMMFLPLVVYGLWRIYRRDDGGRGWRWLALAVGFTGLLQTHLLTTEMAGIFTLLFCILAFKRTLTRPVFTDLCKAVGAAVLWNLWFLVPLGQYILTGACRVGSRYSAAELHDSAAYLGQIFLMFGQGGGYSYSLSLGLSEEMPLTVGTVLALGAGLFLLALLDPAVRRGDRRTAKAGCWFCGFAGLAVWMASDVFPWYDLAVAGNRVTQLLSAVLGKLQFAWRFLGPATALLVLCSCCGLYLWRKKSAGTARQLCVLLALLTVLPAGMLTYEVCRNSVVVNYYSLSAIPTMARQIGGGEYLPANLPDDDNEIITLSAPTCSEGLTVTEYGKNALTVTFTADNESDGDATATLPMYYYPGYRVSGVEGASLADDGGYLQVVLPAGAAGTVTVRFAGFWFWRAADLVSLAAVLATVLLWRKTRRKAAALRG